MREVFRSNFRHNPEGVFCDIMNEFSTKSSKDSGENREGVL